MKVDMKAVVNADPDWFLNQLKKVQTFSYLSDEELMQVLGEMKSFDFKAGTTIVRSIL